MISKFKYKISETLVKGVKKFMDAYPPAGEYELLVHRDSYSKYDQIKEYADKIDNLLREIEELSIIREYKVSPKDFNNKIKDRIEELLKTQKVYFLKLL